MRVADDKLGQFPDSSVQRSVLASLDEPAKVLDPSDQRPVDPDREASYMLRTWAWDTMWARLGLHRRFFPHKPFTRLSAEELKQLLDGWPTPTLSEIDRLEGTRPLMLTPIKFDDLPVRVAHPTTRRLSLWELARLRDPERQKRRQQRDPKMHARFQKLLNPDLKPLAMGVYDLNWWYSDKELIEEFRIWLRSNRPRGKQAPGPQNAPWAGAAFTRRLRDELRWLGALRVCKHYQPSELSHPDKPQMLGVGGPTATVEDLYRNAQKAESLLLQLANAGSEPAREGGTARNRRRPT